MSALTALARGELRTVLTRGYEAWLRAHNLHRLPADRLAIAHERFRAGFLDGYLRLPRAAHAVGLEVTAYEAGFELGETQS